MFAGHVGVALALGRAERQVNVGVFVAAALLLDFLLWLFVLVGVESVTIPLDFTETHQAQFAFPFSHGLLASIGWSIIAGAVVYAAVRGEQTGRWRIGLLIGAAVFSHWILDALVHQPELPLAGATSPLVGLALWDHLTLSLIVESAILCCGLALFVTQSSASRGWSVALAVLSLLTLLLTILGMTIAPPPPSARAMAGSSLVTIAVVCGLAYWFGMRRRLDGEA